MKRPLQIILGATALTALAIPAPGQETTKPQTGRPDYSQHETAQERRADRLNGAAKASDLIGITVHNYQNEKLGTVEDLAVDVESGRVVQVILSTGGFLGIGDSLTAVPPGALHHDVTKKVLHLDADKAKLTAGPRFEPAKWAEQFDTNRLGQVYRHYGEGPAYTFVQPGEVVLEDQRNPDGTQNPERLTPGRQHLIPAGRLGHVQRASKLMGMAVKNRQEEKLGDVNNLLLDLAAGRIVAVVVSSGGFLGLGDELSAVPPVALKFNPERDTLQLNTSKEALASAPHFNANQWPDFSQASYSSGVYRAYQIEPYFATDAKTEADNTQRNVRDRNSRSLTPQDQGNSKTDVATTAQIRKEIMAGANLSVNAQNVKIITNGGHVTLRGPVNSSEEKRIIGDIANRIAQAANVSNQLEVKVNTTSTN